MKYIFYFFVFVLFAVSVISASPPPPPDGGIFEIDTEVSSGSGGSGFYTYKPIEEKPGQGIMNWGVPFLSYTVTTTPKHFYEQIPIKNEGSGTIRGIVYVSKNLQQYINASFCGVIIGQCSTFFVLAPGEQAYLQIEANFDDSIEKGLTGQILYIEKQEQLNEFESVEEYLNQAKAWYVLNVDITRPPGYNIYHNFSQKFGISENASILIILLSTLSIIVAVVSSI